MNKKKTALALFWLGALLMVSLAGVVGRGLYHSLRTLTMDELDATIWRDGGPLFMLWAMSVPLGSILAGIGALVYAKSKPAFAWFAGIGVLAAVIAMVMVWSRVYSSTLFGIGGLIIMLSFLAIVWLWMRRHAALDSANKIAGSLRLIGYLFWVNASWFLCGETAKMHLKAFEGSPAPSPIEIMVFLVLGWLFILAGEYKARRTGMS